MYSVSAIWLRPAPSFLQWLLFVFCGFEIALLQIEMQNTWNSNTFSWNSRWDKFWLNLNNSITNLYSQYSHATIEISIDHKYYFYFYFFFLYPSFHLYTNIIWPNSTFQNNNNTRNWLLFNVVEYINDNRMNTVKIWRMGKITFLEMPERCNVDYY